MQMQMQMKKTGEFDGEDRHIGIPTWSTVDKPVSNGQKQQCYGVFPQRMAQACRHWPVRVPLARKLVWNDASR